MSRMELYEGLSGGGTRSRPKRRKQFWVKRVHTLRFLVVNGIKSRTPSPKAACGMSFTSGK